MKAIWTGSLSFGLVNIPVRLASGSEEKELAFHYLHKEDLSPIRYAKVCRHEGKEVAYDELVRGYEYAKGDYIVLVDEDFRRADLRKTKTIDIYEFVDLKEIDIKYFDKPYYLEPAKGATKAYLLLREALKKSDKAAIGKFVLRQKEILAVIKPEGDFLLLNKLRFNDQLRDPKDLKLPEEAKVENREIDLAIRLIDQLKAHFDPDKYKDTYTKELKRVIAEKAKGHVPKARGEEPVPTKIDDLMDVLRASLAKEGAKR